MAGYEAEAYEMYARELAEAEANVLRAQMVSVAQAQIQQSMDDLLKWSIDHEAGPTDAEVVNDFASYETTWKDRWEQLWK
jgi:hypothetical protein